MKNQEKFYKDARECMRLGLMKEVYAGKTLSICNMADCSYAMFHFEEVTEDGYLQGIFIHQYDIPAIMQNEEAHKDVVRRLYIRKDVTALTLEPKVKILLEKSKKKLEESGQPLLNLGLEELMRQGLVVTGKTWKALKKNEGFSFKRKVQDDGINYRAKFDAAMAEAFREELVQEIYSGDEYGICNLANCVYAAFTFDRMTEEKEIPGLLISPDEVVEIAQTRGGLDKVFRKYDNLDAANVVTANAALTEALRQIREIPAQDSVGIDPEKAQELKSKLAAGAAGKKSFWKR